MTVCLHRWGIWSDLNRFVCYRCGTALADPRPAELSTVRPCGCQRDPFVFGHYHVIPEWSESY